VWNSVSFQLLHTLKGETNEKFTSLAIIHSKEQIVSGAENTKIIIWSKAFNFYLFNELNAANSLEFEISNIEYSSTITSLVIIPSNENIVSISNDNKLTYDNTIIRVWNSTAVQLIANLEGHTGNVLSLAVIPSNEERIVSGSEDKTIKVWDSTYPFQLIHTLLNLGK
jgi:WD40 repeat protein